MREETIQHSYLMKSPKRLSLILSSLLCGAVLNAQTVLTGDHLIEGRLQLGTTLTRGGLKIIGEEGALAVPVFTSSGDGGVVFQGTEGVGAIPMEGNGTRFMWYSGKGALRAGSTDSGWWDDAEIGLNSVAFSYSKAAGNLSFAVNGGEAEGGGSVALNEGYAAGDYTVAIGEGVEARSFKSVVVGSFNAPDSAESMNAWVATDSLFVIGNGSGNPSDPAQYHNAFVVKKNGDVILTGKVEMPVQGDILMGEFGL